MEENELSLIIQIPKDAVPRIEKYLAEHEQEATFETDAANSRASGTGLNYGPIPPPELVTFTLLYLGSKVTEKAIDKLIDNGLDKALDVMVGVLTSAIYDYLKEHGYTGSITVKSADDKETKIPIDELSDREKVRETVKANQPKW